MATKSRVPVKSKALVARKEERKPINSTTKKVNTLPTKKVLPAVKNNQQQPQPKIVEPNTSEFNRLLNGDFTQDFAKQTSRLFRVFLSSTFSDFKVERNELYRRVFPPIKQRCSQLGYEFQVVDMR
jgi:hypothetical protein